MIQFPFIVMGVLGAISLGLVAELLSDDDDQTDEPADDQDDDPTETHLSDTNSGVVKLGDDRDILPVASGFAGHVDAGAGDDAITVQGGSAQEWTPITTGWPDVSSAMMTGPGNTWFEGPHSTAGVDTQPGLTVVTAGAGDDSVAATGDSLWIEGGDGADHIDASGMSGGVIIAGSGDTIIGSGIEGHELAIFGRGDDIVVRGGDHADHIRLRGDSTIDGGAGADTLVTGDGGTAEGGAGDDRIIGNFGTYDSVSTAQDRFDWHVGTGNDLLLGGDGNDMISFDNADTIAGGDGADQLVGFVDGTNGAALIEDFQKGSDQLTINLPGTLPDDFGNFSVDEMEGHDHRSGPRGGADRCDRPCRRLRAQPDG